MAETGHGAPAPNAGSKKEGLKEALQREIAEAKRKYGDGSINEDEVMEQARLLAWERLMKARRVNVGGKTMSLKALYDAVSREEQYERYGLTDDSGTYSLSDGRRKIPGSKIRLGAEKQMLRPEEEGELKLQRVGYGTIAGRKKLLGVVNWLPEKHSDFGIYCIPANVEKLLGKRWACRDPAEVLSSPKFVVDILRKCHGMEMTMMMLASRNIPLALAQPVAKDMLEKSMKDLSGGDLTKQDAKDLESFVKLFDEDRLGDCDWVQDGKIRKGTHVIVSTTSDAGLMAEAISPGTIGSRRTTLIGKVNNPILTAATFERFIGKNAVDKNARENCLRGILWCANGLDTNTRGHTPNHRVSEIDLDGTELLPTEAIVEELSLSTNVFKMATNKRDMPKMFVTGTIN